MINNILNKVGNTPLIPLHIEQDQNINVFAKLEFYNPTGSVKDRAACYWVNQYGNPRNVQAYYNSLGKEICLEVSRQKLDYLFMGGSCNWPSGESDL